MQVKQLKQDGLNYEFEVTEESAKIAKRVDKRLKEASKTIKIAGFRPGKVPMSLMKKRYSQSVMGEVLDLAVSETSVQAMKDKELTPALQPKIEIKTFEEGKDLVYTMAIEVLPKIKLKDYKGFKLTKLIAKTDDTDIDEALEKLASMRKTTKRIEEKRVSKSGDTLLIDFDGRTKDDDVHHEGMAANDYHLELGSNSFIPGFEDQLTGKKEGDKVAVEVSFPEEYGAAELAGRDAIFDVTIHELHENEPAEINEEFAKSLGMEDIAALRKAVEEQANKELNSHSRLKLKKELLDALDNSYDFDIPSGMKDLELDNIMHQIKLDNSRQGIEEEPDDAEKEELKAIAERRVRLGLILAEIGNQNTITVADTELQRAVITEAQKYPGQEKEVFDYFAKNRDALESLRAPLYEEKVVDFILELADVSEKEVSREELTAEIEDDELPKKKTKKKSEPATKKKTKEESEPKKASSKKAS